MEIALCFLLGREWGQGWGGAGSTAGHGRRVGRWGSIPDARRPGTAGQGGAGGDEGNRVELNIREVKSTDFVAVGVNELARGKLHLEEERN